jgi:hypothetical protein
MGLSELPASSTNNPRLARSVGAQAAVGIGLTGFPHLASEGTSRFVFRGSCWRHGQSSLNWHAGTKNLTPEISAELVKIYYNMVLQQLTGIAIELLFARLPWTTFSEVFLQPEVRRILCIYQEG